MAMVKKFLKINNYEYILVLWKAFMEPKWSDKICTSYV